MRGLALTLLYRSPRSALVEHVQSVLDSQTGGHGTSHDDGWLVRMPDSRTGDALLLDIGEYRVSPEAGPMAAHRFDIQETLLDESLTLTISAGPNKAGPDEEAWGDPVELLRAQCTLALALLGEDTLGVFWAGADSLMGADYFRRMVGIWIDGGAFPALGLAALVKDDGGVVRSAGLDVLVGQDVAVLPEDGMSAADQARLAMRVMDFLVREGPVQQDQSVEVDGFGTVNVQIDPEEGVINLYR